MYTTYLYIAVQYCDVCDYINANKIAPTWPPWV
jgi:hypothetical protein